MHSIAEREFVGELFAHAADMCLHGRALESKFPGQHGDRHTGFPAPAQLVDNDQPLGESLFSALFHGAPFLFFALGAGAGHLFAADDAAGDETQLLADLADPLAGDAVLSGQDNVGGGQEFADELLPAGDGEFGGDARVAPSAQHAALAEELADLEMFEPEASGGIGCGQSLFQIQAQDVGLLLFGERLSVFEVKRFHHCMLG